MTENLSENELIKQLRYKLDNIRKNGIGYPNRFKRDSLRLSSLILSPINSMNSIASISDSP